MINIQRQSGFSAVELLITLFIAAVFLMTGFQLYAVIIKNGGDARQQSSAANIAADYLQQYESSATSPCTATNPVTGAAVPGQTNMTVSVSITCPNIPVSSFSATGGTITKNNGYTIHTFTSSGTFTVVNGSNNVDVLVVGGGGGGANTGAGGGAGGYVYKTNYSVSTNPYTITVGAGGNSTATAGLNAFKGSDSVFNDITAEGGGYGATHSGNNNPGGNGGSGGGGGIRTSVAGSPGGTASNGNAGGAGFMDGGWVGGSGGGGGAGSAGSAGSNAAGSGNGGAGLSNSISGTAITYAGGGGGGEVSGTYAGIGGSGVGGTAVVNAVGGSGAVNTGSGGAGGSFNAGYYNIGGTGGSGIVIVRYPTPNPTILTNVSKIVATVTYSNSQKTVSNSTYVSTAGIVTNGLALNLDAGSLASYPAGGPTWTDLSGNGNDGTLSATGVSFTSENGGALSFDGVNGYVSVPNITLDNRNATAEVWLKHPGTLVASQSYASIMVGPQTGIMTNAIGGSLIANTWNTTWTAVRYVTTPDINDSHYHQVVMTLDSNYINLYCDGNYIGHADTVTDFVMPNIGTLIQLGRRSGYPWNGSIAIARIYNRALSSNEITQNYNALKGRYP